jgi:hypothetical protein
MNCGPCWPRRLPRPLSSTIPPEFEGSISRSDRGTGSDLTQIGHKVDLTGDLDKSDVAIQVIADFILSQRFNLRVGHSSQTKMMTGLFEQPATPALSAQCGHDHDIRDMTDSRGLIAPGGDITEWLIGGINQCEDPFWIPAEIIVEMTRLAPLPVMPGNDPMDPFDPLINRDTVKGLDRNHLEGGKI